VPNNYIAKCSRTASDRLIKSRRQARVPNHNFVKKKQNKTQARIKSTDDGHVSDMDVFIIQISSLKSTEQEKNVNPLQRWNG